MRALAPHVGLIAHDRLGPRSMPRSSDGGSIDLGRSEKPLEISALRSVRESVVATAILSDVPRSTSAYAAPSKRRTARLAATELP